MNTSADFLLGGPGGKAKKDTKKPPAPISWKDRISVEEYQSLRETFLIFDQDSSGKIDPTQIVKVFDELDLHHRSPFVLNILVALREKNKDLDFDQFLDCICSKIGQYKTRDGLKRIFALYDTQLTGFIGFQQLKSIARTIGQNLDDEAILELMHSTFINHNTQSNEKFNFEQFYGVISKYYTRNQK